MAKNFLLSERDKSRLQRMLRWFDKQVDIRYQRRRRHGGKGDGGTAGSRNRWFKLTDVASNPMTATSQSCSSGAFSDVTEGVSVYAHPGSAIGNYAVGEYIFASFVGDCWVSVNLFSSDDQMIAAQFEVCA